MLSHEFTDSINVVICKRSHIKEMLSPQSILHMKSKDRV